MRGHLLARVLRLPIALGRVALRRHLRLSWIPLSLGRHLLARVLSWRHLRLSWIPLSLGWHLLARVLSWRHLRLSRIPLSLGWHLLARLAGVSLGRHLLLLLLLLSGISLPLLTLGKNTRLPLARAWL